MSDGTGRIIIAGSGIAGLSAAYRLEGAADVPFTVLEKAPHLGGYSRTLQYGDFRYDLGGHRFYTKKRHIHELVEELLGDDLLEVDRLSRILFRGQFVDYPLSPLNALRALGVGGAARAMFDYGGEQVKGLFTSGGPVETFEQWAVPRFGRYLYEAYFRIYTEKTWGIPCTQLAADFAEQRIKGLSFREAVKDAILRGGKDETLVRRFIYPRYGFGQLPDALADAIAEPNRLLVEHEVVGLEHDGDHITGAIVEGADGDAARHPCCEFVNSIPIDETVRLLRPAPPAEVLRAADVLRYRSLVILLLTLDVEQVSPDHWIYVSDPEIGFCRMHEPKNWSPEMAPPRRTALVLEFFCQQGDQVWTRDPRRLVDEAVADLQKIGLVEAEAVSDFTTVRMPKAYPVYQLGYKEALDAITGYLARFPNLYNIGRNATFLYTSSDHYIDMGLKAAENVLGHEHDLEKIGRKKGYAETWQADEKWS